MRQLYLDYCATTPIAPSVREAMLPFLGEHFGNPSSSHALGRAALEAVEDARGQVATCSALIQTKSSSPAAARRAIIWR